MGRRKPLTAGTRTAEHNRSLSLRALLANASVTDDFRVRLPSVAMPTRSCRTPAQKKSLLRPLHGFEGLGQVLVENLSLNEPVTDGVDMGKS